MSALLNFLEAIASGVSAALDFLLSLISDIAYMAKLTATFVVQIPEYLSFLPSQVLALVVSMFAIVVIYKLLGREG